MTWQPDRREAVTEAVRVILTAITDGDWRDDPGMAETPRRVTRFYEQFSKHEPGNIYTTFQSVTVDQMVAVTGVRVWSLCAHHLLPFSANVTIAYIADDKIVGLSKLPRLAKFCAARPQTQEALCEDIAIGLSNIVRHDNVAVIADGEHLCVAMRGVEAEGTIMHTSVLRGAFNQPATRAELMELVKR